MRWELRVYLSKCLLDKNMKMTHRWKRYRVVRFRTKREALSWLRLTLKLDRKYKLEGVLKYTLRGGVKRV